MPPEIPNRMTGPVLEAGDIARAVIAAMREQYPQLQVHDQGSYLRVLCPERCGVSRASIERRLGRGFVLPGELEQIMPSFRGRLRMDEDQVEWFLEG